MESRARARIVLELLVPMLCEALYKISAKQSFGRPSASGFTIQLYSAPYDPGHFISCKWEKKYYQSFPYFIQQEEYRDVWDWN